MKKSYVSPLLLYHKIIYLNYLTKESTLGNHFIYRGNCSVAIELHQIAIGLKMAVCQLSVFSLCDLTNPLIHYLQNALSNTGNFIIVCKTFQKCDILQNRGVSFFPRPHQSSLSTLSVLHLPEQKVVCSISDLQTTSFPKTFT